MIQRNVTQYTTYKMCTEYVIIPEENIKKEEKVEFNPAKRGQSPSQQQHGARLQGPAEKGPENGAAKTSLKVFETEAFKAAKVVRRS